MFISGLQKVSLQDYPDKLSCILFTQGCNFRCGFCHNPELIGKSKGTISNEEIFDYLKKRKNVLEGVVITGGEPTIQKNLLEFIKKVKELGYLVKLDTNGSNPDVIQKCIEFVDFIAMDYKFSLEKYEIATGCPINKENIKRSKEIIIASKIKYEFRVTIIEELFTKERVKKIAEELKSAKTVSLQGFKNTKVFDSSFEKFRNTTEIYLQQCKAFFQNQNILIRH